MPSLPSLLGSFLPRVGGSPPQVDRSMSTISKRPSARYSSRAVQRYQKIPETDRRNNRLGTEFMEKIGRRIRRLLPLNLGRKDRADDASVTFSLSIRQQYVLSSRQPFLRATAYKMQRPKCNSHAGYGHSRCLSLTHLRFLIRRRPLRLWRATQHQVAAGDGPHQFCRGGSGLQIRVKATDGQATELGSQFSHAQQMFAADSNIGTRTGGDGARRQRFGHLRSVSSSICYV